MARTRKPKSGISSNAAVAVDRSPRRIRGNESIPVQSTPITNRRISSRTTSSPYQTLRQAPASAIAARDQVLNRTAMQSEEPDSPINFVQIKTPPTSVRPKEKQTDAGRSKKRAVYDGASSATTSKNIAAAAIYEYEESDDDDSSTEVANLALATIFETEEPDDEEDEEFDEYGDDEDDANDSVDMDDVPLAVLQEMWNRRVEDNKTDENRYVAKNDMPMDTDIFMGYFGTGKTKTALCWTTHPPDDVHELNFDCQMGTKPTLTDYGDDLKETRNPVDFLKKIITPPIVETILRHTNALALDDYEKRFEKFRSSPSNKRRPKPWKTLDEDEFWAFVGAHYYMGCKGLGKRSIYDLFGTDGDEIHLPLVQAFSRDRFLAIKKYLRFHDKVNEAPNESRENRRLKIEQFLGPMIANCGKLIEPSNAITVDESLLSFKGRCGFIQYISNKPDKFGIKIFVLSDATTGAVLAAIVYVGQEGETRETGQCTRVVLDLIDKYRDTGRTVITDRYYSSPTLASELKERGLHFVGTLQAKRQGLPKEFVDFNLQDHYKEAEKASTAAVGKRKKKPTVAETVETVASQSERALEKAKLVKNAFVFHDHMTLVKFEPKEKKKIHLLSTLHHTPAVSTKSGKPEVVEYYNEHKFGVDLTDQLVKNYTTKRTNVRWPMRCFYWGLDIAALQGFIAYRLAHPDVAEDVHYRSNFMNDLWRNLMRAQIKKRRESMKKSPHMKKILALTYALRRFRRTPLINPSLSMSALKSTFASPPPTNAPSKRRLFADDPVPGKRQRNPKGACYSKTHTHNKRTEFKCQRCRRWICWEHRVDTGEKNYICADMIETPCNRVNPGN